jgi:hypothetical protein
MLHYESVDTKALELVKLLQKVPEFTNLRLVDGTCLALQIGHRKSIDIDLFGTINSDALEISKKLDQIGSVTKLKSSENINIYIIDGIKVDIVNYHYKWLDDPITENGLVIAKKKDIAAMKLSAITGRGTKKDFVDLYFLFNEYSLEQMLDFYSQKYHDGSTFLVLKSLAYFIDADSDENPVMLKSMNWEKVKEFIINKLEQFSTKHD